MRPIVFSEYRSEMEKTIERIRADMERQLNVSLKSKEPQCLRQAEPKDIIEGAIIWMCSDNGILVWMEIEEVINPYSLHKGFVNKNDGCIYGLDGAKVEF